MHSRVHETVLRPSVRPSVCHIYRPLQQRAAGLLLWAPRADVCSRRGRLSIGIRSSTAISSKCRQYSIYHVISWREKLDIDFFFSACIWPRFANLWKSRLLLDLIRWVWNDLLMRRAASCPINSTRTSSTQVWCPARSCDVNQYKY